jgi:hypothetical protein
MIQPPLRDGWRHAAPVLALLTCAWALADDCDLPRFRHALARWPGDVSTLQVSYAPEQATAAEAALATLRDRPLNLRVESQVIAGAAAPGYAWYANGAEQPLLSGRLTAPALAALAASPARRELVRRLLAGQSVVFILLESSDAAANAAARTLLAAELERLAGVLFLPVLEETELPLPKVPLTLAFSLLAVDRAAPAEAALVAQLLQVEPDLASLPPQPIVFPVFGRGRVPYALAGAGISADNLEEACRYLVAAGACEAKADAPGQDLLLEAAWAAELGLQVSTVPPAPALALVVGAQTPTLLPPTALEPALDDAPYDPFAPPPSRAGWLLALIIGVVVLAVALALAYIRRSRRRTP